jgi:hypothetical protein
MPSLRAGARLGLFAAAFLPPLAAASCYEIPPVVPPDYAGSATATGWPPLAVYDDDAFDPANRWFQRAFGSRDSSGDVLAPHADEPTALLDHPSPVDGVEIAALLEAIESAPPLSPGELGTRRRGARAVFLCDTAAESSRIEAQWSAGAGGKEIAARLRRIATREPLRELLPPASTAELTPPPLREGTWKRRELPSAPGLLPSPLDRRVTQAFESEDGHVRALLRLRCVLEGEAWVETPLGSECWFETAGGVEPGARGVWRFDRAEWLQGREPWREVPGGAEITIRDPSEPSRRLHGARERLCAGCHCRP